MLNLLFYVVTFQHLLFHLSLQDGWESALFLQTLDSILIQHEAAILTQLSTISFFILGLDSKVELHLLHVTNHKSESRW